MLPLTNKKKKKEIDFGITDKDYPFKYVLGQFNGEIINGEPAMEVTVFEIEKEGDMINASCDNPKIFLSAENWDILKNKIDMQFGIMGEDDE